MSATLVSGVNGFIAQHIVNELLLKGYKVIGTVRSKEKAEVLEDLFHNENLKLEVVPDLSTPGAFDAIFSKYGNSVKYVIHTASPCHYRSLDFENDMLIPALNGTKSIFESIKKYSANSVEHFVYTSSFAAISNVQNAYKTSLTLNEESWNNDTWSDSLRDAKTAYYGSKAFAERAAWAFLEQNKDLVHFSLTTINPCYVFGPQLFDESISETLNASCQLVNEIILSKPGDEVDQNFASFFIDVRDVAKAHVLALERSNLIGKRLILANTKFSSQDIVDTVNKDFPELSGKITKGITGYGAKVTQKIANVDNTRSRELLGYEFRSFQNAVGDTVSQILRVRGGTF